MWPWLERVLDIIAPRKDRVVRLENYSVADLHPDVRTLRLCGHDVTTLASYKTRGVEDCIRALKYDHASAARPLLASLLSEYLHEELGERRRISTRRIVLIPVPLHPKRERERGFNQIHEVLKALPSAFSDGSLSTIDARALSRTRETAQQTRLSRAERLENVRGAFTLRDPRPLVGMHVYLFDDVVTTGATLSEAAQPLIDAGIPVELIALARA